MAEHEMVSVRLEDLRLVLGKADYMLHRSLLGPVDRMADVVALASMKQDAGTGNSGEIPDGTIAALGHPANGVVARKIDGEWLRFPLDSGRAWPTRVDLDDQRALRILWSPDEEESK